MHALAKRSFWLLAALVVFAPCLCARAQGTPIVEEPGYTPTLTFDVVSIREVTPQDGNVHASVASPPASSRFSVTTLPMSVLVQIAYGFDAPVVGLPDWARNTFFNVEARSDDAADARLAKLTPNEVRLEKRNAVRVMLADRLGLKSHMETRNSAIYNLVVSKGGVKMQAVPAAAAGDTGTPPPVNVQAHGSQHGLEFVATNANMRAVSGVLGSMVEAPVVDKTGLTGTYNFTLQFGREWSSHDPDSYPSIFTAVQEQLGLKLEATHADVPNLVIDHMTKPTAN
jgi:uncharacterized protein (TIGR03435 family)